MKFALVSCWAALVLPATTISFRGNLRNDANFTNCGQGCTLGPGNSDGDYAQWAAVADTFNVSATSTMSAVTSSYGGGTNGQGAAIAQRGFEPCLTLFDSAGNFLASTFAGATCRPGFVPGICRFFARKAGRR